MDTTEIHCVGECTLVYWTDEIVGTTGLQDVFEKEITVPIVCMVRIS